MTHIQQLYSAGSTSIAVYDLQTALFSGECEHDIAFYAAAARPGSKVLELGVGTGRVSFALAAGGCHVTGLDISPGMLEVATAKLSHEYSEISSRLDLRLGDMANFELSETYDLVVAPFRSFNHLLTDEEALGCIMSTYRHLRAGGKAIFHMMGCPAHLRGAQGEPPPDPPASLDFPDASRLTFQFCRRKIDVARRIADLGIQYTYTDAVTRLVQQSREYWKVRWFTRGEILRWSEMAGLSVHAEYSDFHRSPRRIGKDQIWVLTKSER